MRATSSAKDSPLAPWPGIERPRRQSPARGKRLVEVVAFFPSPERKIRDLEARKCFGALRARKMADGRGARARSAAVDAARARRRRSKGLPARATDETLTADAPSRRETHVRLKLALDGRDGGDAAQTRLGVGERAFDESNGGARARWRRSRRHTARATDEATVARASMDDWAHARRALALVGRTSSTPRSSRRRRR